MVENRSRRLGCQEAVKPIPARQKLIDVRNDQWPPTIFCRKGAKYQLQLAGSEKCPCLHKKTTKKGSLTTPHEFHSPGHLERHRLLCEPPCTPNLLAEGYNPPKVSVAKYNVLACSVLWVPQNHGSFHDIQ